MTDPIDHRELLPVGANLLGGSFVIKGVLGRGGFGVTYLALKTGLDKFVAIKECFPELIVIRKDQTVYPKSSGHKNDFKWVRDRFFKEGKTIDKLKHPNIIDVGHVFEENGTAYMELEYLEGRTFGDLLGDLDRKPTEHELRLILDPILSALETVHDNDSLHRDIAPDNIFIKMDGSPVLIDFGASRIAASKHSQALGTRPVAKDGYSPSEQYISEGSQGPWTDLYALGATFYRAITGEPPTSSKDRDYYLGRKKPDPLKKLSDLKPEGYSQSFLAAMDATLEVIHEDRPQSVADLRKLLSAENAVLSQEGTETTVSHPLLIGSATFLILLATLVALALFQMGYFDGETNPIPAKESTHDAEIEDPGSTYKVMYVDADGLNVREGPGMKYRTVGIAKFGEEVSIIAEIGNWRKIKGIYSNGWVYASHLSEQAP